MKDLRDYTEKELTDMVVALGFPKFRADQIFNWVYKSKAASIDQMKNLPQELKEALKKEHEIASLKITATAESVDGTKKLLFEFSDGAKAECVMLPDEDEKNVALCISSQAGCACACSFCATGALGFNRDLKPSEILAQFMEAEKQLGKVPDTIVFMGMGEPLLNWENLKKTIRILSEKKGYNYSQRRITVSTVGIVAVIKEIADSDFKFYLAVSLIAAENEKRSKLIPMNKKYPLREIIEACKYYYRKTKEEVFIEYILFDGVNDSPEHAEALAALLRGVKCKINLIPYNNVAGLPFKAPERDKVTAFQTILIEYGYKAFIRREKGADIAAACGQLAAAETKVDG